MASEQTPRSGPRSLLLPILGAALAAGFVRMIRQKRRDEMARAEAAAREPRRRGPGGAGRA